MAFQIDWSLINSRTPEQREADRLAAYERIKSERTKLVGQRKELIENLLPHINSSMSEKDRRFIYDMEYKSTSFDSDGQQGGALADLTKKQIDYLTGLHQRHVISQITTEQTGAAMPTPPMPTPPIVFPMLNCQQDADPCLWTHFDCWDEEDLDRDVTDEPKYLDFENPKAISITHYLLEEWSEKLCLPSIHPDALRGSESFEHFYLTNGCDDNGNANIFQKAFDEINKQGLYAVYASSEFIEIYNRDTLKIVDVGIYSGKITEIDDQFATQKIGRDPTRTARHLLAGLSENIKVGDVVTIHYSCGRGIITDKQKEVER